MVSKTPDMIYEEFESQTEEPTNKFYRNVNPKYVVVVMIILCTTILLSWMYPTMDKTYLYLMIAIEIGGGLLITFSQTKREFAFIKEEAARLKGKKYLDYHKQYLTRNGASDLPDGEYKIGSCFRVDQSSPWNKPLFWLFNFKIIKSNHEEEFFHLKIDGNGDVIKLDKGNLEEPIKVIYRVPAEQQADFAWRKGGQGEFESDFGQT